MTEIPVTEIPVTEIPVTEIQLRKFKCLVRSTGLHFLLRCFPKAIAFLEEDPLFASSVQDHLSKRNLSPMEDLRKQYGNLPPVTDADLAENPIDQFKAWFQQASDVETSDWYEPNVMTLATASKSGEVSARIVLLKGADDQGLVFYTNYDSRKGRQLAENPRAAVVMHWPMLERQVRVEGEVEKVSRSLSERYFHSRPRGSQIGAAVSPQSEPIADRQELETLAAELDQKHAGQTIPLPENWGGYRIKPSRFEFWQGQKNRLHDRFIYEHVDGGWVRGRVAP